jgi:hypothetical protein
MADVGRRGFLGAILAAGVAPAFVSAKVLMPVRTIWTPPQELMPLTAGLVTSGMIQREALRILESRLAFTEILNRDWDGGACRILVRKPRKFAHG